MLICMKLFTLLFTLTLMSLVASAQAPAYASSAPVAGLQATVTLPPVTGQSYSVNCVSFSADALVAPSFTGFLTVVIRDGASGVGTIMHEWRYVVPAAQKLGSIVRLDFCGLQLINTAGNALTIEFTAGAADIAETISINGII